MTPIAFVGFDCETTGLHPRGNPPDALLEVGMIAYTADLTPVSQFSSLVFSPRAQARIDAGNPDPVVWKMHLDSGLWDELYAIRSGRREADISPAVVEQTALDWLDMQGITEQLPMLGSSITFDRGFLDEEMPRLHSKFHYHSLDATSIITAVETVAGCPVPVPENEGKHRVLADIEHSAEIIRQSLRVLEGN